MFSIEFSIGNKAQFETMDELNSWLERNIKLNSFGRNERWKREESFDNDESIEAAIETREVEDFDGVVLEYKFGPDYTYEISDISVAYEKEENRVARVNRGKAVRTICENILDSIIGFNMEADRTAVEIETMKETFAEILALLQAYQPFTAKSLIETIEVDETVTQDMKDEILSYYPEGII